MKSRLRQMRKELGLTQAGLAKKLNCNAANIAMIETGRSSLSEKNKMLLVQFLNINPQWLEGEDVPMLMTDDESTAQQNYRLAMMPESVPLYDLEKTDNLAQLFRRSGSIKPSGYINIPHLPRCDGAVRVAGDSMSPVLRSGDIVLYRQLSGTSGIFWGDMYLVSIETSAGEYVAVRYIRKSAKAGMAILAGENPAYADTEVELSRIRAIAFVKATIRMNTAK